MRGFTSIDAYLTKILTEKPVVDVGSYKERFSTTNSFIHKYHDLRYTKMIVEIAPDTILQYNELEKAGISQADIQKFCDDVAAFVPDGVMFSIHSLREDGFQSRLMNRKLFDSELSDWLLANLLFVDSRFVYGKIYGTIILKKGEGKVSTASVFRACVSTRGSIGKEELFQELTDRYGCDIGVPGDLEQKIKKTEMYYDRKRKRLYATRQRFTEEIGEIAN